MPGHRKAGPGWGGQGPASWSPLGLGSSGQSQPEGFEAQGRRLGRGSGSACTLGTWRTVQTLGVPGPRERPRKGGVPLPALASSLASEWVERPRPNRGGLGSVGDTRRTRLSSARVAQAGTDLGQRGPHKGLCLEALGPACRRRVCVCVGGVSCGEVATLSCLCMWEAWEG